MATNKFSIGEAIQFGWNTMTANFWFFVGLLIVAALLGSGLDIIDWLTEGKHVALTIIMTIVSMVLQIIVGMGLIRIALRFCDNQKAKLADLLSCVPLFFKYLFASIVYGLIMIAGFILLIVPAIIWGIKFQFYTYFIVDKGLGPIKALKASSAITQGVKWDLFLFGLLLGLINLLGVTCLIIGLFATIPMTMVATAFVYRKLLSAAALEGVQVPTFQAEGISGTGGTFQD